MFQPGLTFQSCPRQPYTSEHTHVCVRLLINTLYLILLLLDLFYILHPKTLMVLTGRFINVSAKRLINMCECSKIDNPYRNDKVVTTLAQPCILETVARL